MPLDPEPLKDILYRTTARYLTIRPHGIDLDGRLVPSVVARILAYGGARTLYRGRRPQCRSLDGVRSTKGRLCADCVDLDDCTPQVRLDLLIEHRPYRLLLAYTSAKQFLLHTGAAASRGRRVEEVATRILVVNRGSWGELRFAEA